MLTFANAKLHVTFVLGNRTDISTYVPRWINWAYQDCWNQLDVHQKEDISSGNCTSAQKYISIPSGTYQILRVVVNGDVLERREWREYTSISTWPSGVPTKYYIFSTYIYFDMSPASTYAYSIYRHKDLTALSGDSDTASLPDAYEPALLSRSIAYGYRDLQMPQESAHWFTISQQQLDAAKAPHWRENADWDRGLRVDLSRRTR